MKMMEVFLGIGTNLGKKEQNLRKSLELTEKYIGPVVVPSSVYETEPWGFESNENFLNMAICVKTNLNALVLIEKTMLIESQLGRIRIENQYSSRVIDIDILFYGDQVINESGLIIPHPRIAGRRFVLEPLIEIAPGFVHPVLKKSITSLLESCTDTCKVINKGTL
jgi:2-amino-4-hydroxy-6-hydroxymethyldihydropteridine diphosphokinase